MKFALLALCFTYVAAVPIKQSETVELGHDWASIKPINIFVEPIGPAPESPIGRIVGGTVATRNGFPYQVALIINNSGFCGGSIISNQWVLTAAHCIDSATSVQVIAGAHNPSTTVNEPTQVRIAAEARTVHKEWNRQTLSNDVALLRASEIPITNDGISAIQLAASDSGTFAGSTATLTGWGRTSDASNSIAQELQVVELPVITNAVCQSSFGNIVQEQHVCTSGAGGRGGCNGDSGGPLVVNGIEIGIVSFGSSLCEGGHPTAFARVSHFRNWINTNSGI
ncbi:brachyurin-like [Euwallacea similis]|uniref:brachyurin-like n=1 Tax=Euwallacea similis TaxID=1736056 RepID=UPI00344DD54A